MNRVGKVKAVAAGTVLAGSAAIAALLPTSPAVAFFSGGLSLDISLGSPGTLVAKGAAVTIPVTYSCNGPSAGISVQATEKTGHTTASGSGFEQVGCTGSRVTTLVTLQTNGTAFAKGTAAVWATINGCTADFVTCGNESANGTVKIVK